MPECFNSPYGTQYFHEYSEVEKNSTTLASLKDQLKKTPCYLVAGSIPEMDNKKCYNTSFIFNPDGEIIGKHRKVHLFDIDIPGKITFQESLTLSPGETSTAVNIGKANLGVGICYDIRFPEQALYMRYKQNCNLLVYPGAFNMTTGPAHWELLARGRAIDTQSYVIVASPARHKEEEKDYEAWGHSSIISPWADVVAKLDENEGILVSELNFDKVEEIRQNIPIQNQRKPGMFDSC